MELPKKIKKFDLLVSVLFLLTILSLLLFRTVFPVLLWLLVILLVIRILFYLKRKLLWKTRNRLIFSGLFFVITPIILILIFFLFIIYIIIAQYGVIIIDNLINRQLNQLEYTVDRYLVQSDGEEMLKRIDQLVRFKPKNLIIAFYENRRSGFERFFVYPDGFDLDRFKVNQFSGYVKVHGNLYLGVMKERDKYAVMISQRVDQDFLDQLSTISDFKMKFVEYDSAVDGIGKTQEIASMASERGERLFLPWPYRFTFLDFDRDTPEELVEREHLHWLLVDYDKIFQKITGLETHTVQLNIKKFVYFLIGLFATFIVISFFVGFRIVRVITKSINLITRGTQKIRKGDFDFRIRIKSGDQLQYLAESFNEMSSGIKRLLVQEKEKQRLEEELRIARSIQLKLLPKEDLNTPEFEIAAINIPAEEIAGDYFDYFYKARKYLYVLVADVSGKGTSAAFYMAELKGIMNVLEKKEISPADLISECHESLSRSFDKATFITMNIARFGSPDREFVFCRAGHTPAVFFDYRKKQCQKLDPAGNAIGLINFTRKNLEEIRIPYRSGDILFLFSDGLSEIMNREDEMLGIDNLMKIIKENHQKSAAEIKQKILDFSIAFSESNINPDDLTFVVLKVR